ncbi:SGNH/GDSL hydrolase family protein [Geodermatophilus sp. SYSU D00691]
MTTRLLRLLGVLLCAVALALAATVAASPGASAAAAPPIDYVALGDSSASGQGTGLYDLGGSPCWRSGAAYGPLWAQRHAARSFALLACSGATTLDVLATQVPQIPRDTDLVTLTIGGNDVGFWPIMQTCTLAVDDQACLAAIGQGTVIATTVLPVRLSALLVAVHRAAPHARVLVLGYPRLFELGPCPAPVPNETRRTALNAGADLLDQVIGTVTRAFGDTFVDVRDRFTGHGICAPAGQDWINGPLAGVDTYHPDRDGYALGFLPALTAATG